MSLLTDREINDIGGKFAWANLNAVEPGNAFARAVEAAVIRKLATVSVEWPESASSSHEVYLREQIEPMLAAARVQALEEAAKRIEGPNNNYGAVIRALIGCKDD